MLSPLAAIYVACVLQFSVFCSIWIINKTSINDRHGFKIAMITILLLAASGALLVHILPGATRRVLAIALACFSLPTLVAAGVMAWMCYMLSRYLHILRSLNLIEIAAQFMVGGLVLLASLVVCLSIGEAMRRARQTTPSRIVTLYSWRLLLAASALCELILFDGLLDAEMGHRNFFELYGSPSATKLFATLLLVPLFAATLPLPAFLWSRKRPAARSTHLARQIRHSCYHALVACALLALALYWSHVPRY